ncbi:Ribosomal protein L4/L1e, bacterial-type [Candidatus Magnetoovum chiemensis]|nr:Ribosomal protein L4/L1e, bacterial-type [Candidatus Magnetoovum chiemensis]
MLEAEVKDIDNQIKEKIELPKEYFGKEVRKDILHEAVVNYLANQRQGTHSTKTKGKVRGGGKKPWRQKHTGRARCGSTRSPIWKGGGTVFGPQPRDYSYKLNKKFKQLAVKIALSAKHKDGEVIVLDSIKLDMPKTKEMFNILNKLNVLDKTVLILLHDVDKNIVLSSRNIVGIDVTTARYMTTYEILAHDIIIITKDTINALKDKIQ